MQYCINIKESYQMKKLIALVVAGLFVIIGCAVKPVAIKEEPKDPAEPKEEKKVEQPKAEEPPVVEEKKDEKKDTPEKISGPEQK